jgi:hypothetical protein
MDKKSTEFDGIYFLPGEEEGELVISYFDFKSEMAGAKSIEGTPLGPKYHIAFFKRGEDGLPAFDDSFEAILTCPKVYIESLAGVGVYGCAVKKTEKSQKWFDDYLTRTVGHITIKKLVGCLKSVLETK